MSKPAAGPWERAAEALADHRAPAFDFIDDGRSLPALDHRDDRGHDEEEDQDCPQEKPGLE